MKTVFQFDKKLSQTIDTLSGKMKLSKSDVIERAIALYKIAQEAVNEGERIMLIRTDGEVVTERQIILP